ncbi:hypothetical protein LX87_02952 [Larkinella arboricola]|uniref:Uncharacterized protein n=1 Tax=Larkinella arboricola TaxID=643671 RepID=A0A327X178_LARAB|nr:hypothetical protein [Larkinella arboricola]RAJ98044.1 hypothetical protein LX87_02952 [Larkinella arboricola]
MNRIFSVFALLLTIAFFSSCGLDQNQSSKELAREMNDRKIKRVTDAQLTVTVDDWGKAIVQTSRKALTTELAKKSNDKSLCSLEGIPAIQKLEKQYAVSIDLLSSKDTANQALDAKERELLLAYRYNALNKLEQIDNIQKVHDTLFVYNSPVPVDDIICKTCTDDAALSFVIWRVTFKKREVIRRINPKKLQ